MKTQESTLPRGKAAVVAESVTQRVASSAHDTIDSAAVKADEIETHLRAGAVNAGAKLEASQDAATVQVEKSLAKLESFVKAKPIVAAGIAFAAGILATTLIRR